VTELSLRDKVNSSTIQRERGVELLLLHIKGVSWYRHLVRMPLGHLCLEVFRACPTGRKAQDRPRTRWRDYNSLLALECLEVPQEELEGVTGERDVWVSLLDLLPL